MKNEFENRIVTRKGWIMGIQNSIFQILWFCFIFIYFNYHLHAQSNKNLKLWYEKPAGNTWENALPIGNGFLGGMIYGNISNETIALNEHTVWSGSPNQNLNPAALTALQKIRELVFTKRYDEAQKLAHESIISKSSHGQKFQPVGSLQLQFSHDTTVTEYHRSLDLQTAIAQVSYKSNGVTYRREAFASFDHKSIILKLTADKPAQISFSTYFKSPHTKKQINTFTTGQIHLMGTTSDHETVPGRIRFKSIAQLKPIGGKMNVTDTSISIQQADSAIIYISIATNFNSYTDLSGDENMRAETIRKNVLKDSYAKLRQKHIYKYQTYFNRVDLDLGTSESIYLPTDTRLFNFRSTNDPQLVTLYFQYGRYLLISSSQPGGQPANLQGIWNHRLSPPWDSKYTININAQMNYWPAEKTNLPELHQPLIQMIKELSITGQQSARQMYGARGWMAHHNTDIWRATGAVDGAFWGIWPTGGAWLSLHLWEHYLYNGNKKFLADVYPIIKNAALFFVDFLIPHPQYGWLVACPSISPENAPKDIKGMSITAGATMDNQIIADLFYTTIQAATILNKKDPLVDTIQSKLALLPPMQVGKYNQLQEWLEDLDDPEDKHRHISHLYGLYPSSQISPYKYPELFIAAKNTLLQRGDVSTGWSMGWKVNWWAKLLDGNHAYKLIQSQLTPIGINKDGGGTYNNLFDAHPPFQIDGNFGCTAGIAEMLMQCADDAIHILPALPDIWPSGKITGLRARGGFEIIDMQWKESTITNLVIKSNFGGNLRIRTANALKLANGIKLKLATGKNPNIFFDVIQLPEPIISKQAKLEMLSLKETKLYDIPTKKGQIISIIKME